MIEFYVIVLNSWIGVILRNKMHSKNKKSTLQELFVIRLLIELCKKTLLYIGYFELEKDFDKVSRLLLLRKLVKLGICSCILKGLEMSYSSTFCVLSSGSRVSQLISKYRGIRKSAPSSVPLHCFYQRADQLPKCALCRGAHYWHHALSFSRQRHGYHQH